jgi:integration host factor subunit alpha
MPTTMTKADLIEALHTKLDDVSKKDATDLVEEVFKIMKETLAQGPNSKLKISGFGNFVVRDKKERIGRNPQTNEPITIAPRRVVTFQLSPVLRTAINGGDPTAESDNDSEDFDDDDEA